MGVVAAAVGVVVDAEVDAEVVDAEVVDAEEVKFLASISLIYLPGVYPRLIPSDFSRARLTEICTHLCRGLCNIQIVFEHNIPMRCQSISASRSRRMIQSSSASSRQGLDRRV